ncbi:hypothetical protein ACFSKU_12940 [Pontibacter silvestris]|uniref:Uncharacterized protein n=1 Tax=Pontibacter silvestris TaxID=2305183 RepID=A0ABW4X0U5_9BACT|nr:hypothetical protein [Pontibacter silvestris]MCC9135647.1 hypothetical protein [Pontibacter silvestris]
MSDFTHNTLRWKYSLTVRLLVLLLLINTVASACNTDSPTDEHETDVTRERNQKQLASSDTTAARRATRHKPTTIALLGNPFVANASQSNSLSSYFNCINDDFTLDADPIENRHRSSVTDTIYTIRFGSSLIEFYAPSQTGQLLIQVADIQNNSIVLRNNMRVGMSHAELLGKLRTQEIVVTQNPNEVIASNKDGAPTSLRFFLKNGKVSRIRYDGYVD